MKRLTKPSTQTFLGRAGRLLTGASSRRPADNARREARILLAQHWVVPNSCYAAIMLGGSTPAALTARFAKLVEQLGGDVTAAKTLGQQRSLLSAVGQYEPATLNQIASRVRRGAP